MFGNLTKAIRDLIAVIVGAISDFKFVSNQVNRSNENLLTVLTTFNSTIKDVARIIGLHRTNLETNTTQLLENAQALRENAEVTRVHTDATRTLYGVQDTLTRSILNLSNDIQALRSEIVITNKLLRLRRPGLVFLKVLREDNNMLVFVLSLPAMSAKDVVKRVLTVQVGDAEPVTQEIVSPEIDALGSQEFKGKDNDTVSGTLVDIDDAGNKSEPSEFSFVLTDTIAPPKPGEIGLTVLREEDDEPEVDPVDDDTDPVDDEVDPPSE